jgi:tetratricopeptide (TPR) repeat protein
VQLSGEDQTSFTETLCSDVNAVVFSMSEIDVQRSEAWNPLDRERIFAAIAATPGGFRAVNLRVMTHMREWVLSTAQDLLDRLHADPDYAFGAMKVGNQLSLLYKRYGDLAKAEALSRRVLADMERLVPADHPVLFTTLNNHAALLQAQEKFEEAEELFRRAFEGKRSVLGETHLETVQAQSNWATVLLSLERFSEAEKVFREVLEIAQSAYGTDSHVTITCMNNLAMGVKDSGGSKDEVLCLLRAAQEASARVQGESHPATLESLNNLGTALLELCDLPADAEEIHRKCLGLRERVLGESHPDTLESLSNLIAALQRGGVDQQTEAAILVKRYHTMQPT